MDVSKPLKWARVNNLPLVTIECDEYVNRIPKLVVVLQCASFPYSPSIAIRGTGKYGANRQITVISRLEE